MSEIERDREVDRAWRAASSEEPPPKLDAAIRAEARRAVGASPGDVRRRRRRQLRYPFAAAATVALLAFGIVQMIPPDQDALSVSDQEPASTQAQRSKDAAPPRETPAAPAPQREPAAPTAPAPATATDSKVAAPPPAPQAQLRAKTARAAEERTAQPRTPEAARDSQRKDQPAPDEGFAAAPSPAEPSAAAGTVAQNAARSEPFPAASPAAKPEQGAAGGAAPSAPARRSLATAPVAVAKVSNLDEIKAKEAGAGSVESWIARIRELKASGQLDAAAKELAKFREAYGERADALLPADLRAKAP